MQGRRSVTNHPSDRTGAGAARANRSQLVAPGSSDRFMAKAAASGADVVLLDLEDAVPLDEKDKARERVIAAVRQLDFGRKAVSVRINAPDTPFMYRDLIAVAERAGPRLDLIMVPKINCAADVHMLDVLLGQIEAATGRQGRIGLELQIETAQGLQNVDAIAAASPRVESLHFGPGDFAASVGARTTSIGGFAPDYGVLAEPGARGERAFHPADPWHYVLAKIVVAARAAGVRPVDGPYADFNDPQGLTASARRAAALGFEGKWAIHPSQVETINDAFSPTAGELEQARAILDALARAHRDGRGAVTLDGRMIDAASVRQARQLLAKAGT
jgi:malyl-CoA/(S)-citramalyl-CoA lyase